MIEEQRQHHARNQQEFNPEWVVVVVVGGAELHVHQVECAQRRNDKDELHESVVDADEGCEEIQIATEINDSEENLWFAGNA